jgi:hypothetical protein
MLTILLSRLFNAAFAISILAGILLLESLLISIPIRSASNKWTMIPVIGKDLQRSRSGIRASCAKHFNPSNYTDDPPDGVDNRNLEYSSSDKSVPSMPEDADSRIGQAQFKELNSSYNQDSSDEIAEAAAIRTGAISRPCPLRCCARISGLSAMTRPRDAVTISFAGEVRLPNLGISIPTLIASVCPFEILKDRLQPRAPPESLS